ncbi:protocatechuate 3,4-dioxygenase subunit alpha [Mycobacterium terramassiliense]|uniref:Protocatechuate 3,4-dioxygenase beta subunit n=1 Tax=Mycobacterium terramassiliense TaxID=1841859 RepID=A0A2U3N8F3_9MYCO|nr:protocatechuate 3,4-dioxygenase subunit alpha [Mycobacterium terramassiliense]SPM27739.1 Protocatechuate 3,4-dioxygenase beta subunit [Mycobacterium terramassiliense]
MTELPCTPGQTVGPFLGLGLPYPGDSDLVADGHPHAVRLHGTVYDGAGEAVPDALVELWQRDGAGRIPRREGSLRRGDAGFTGWGRCATDAAGHYAFTTVPPGADSGRPPFFAIAVFARGLLHRLFTRAYLPHVEVNADAALAALVCISENDGATYRFDIHLQGPNETVFLEFRR